jgi:hypothetical protein
MLIFKLYQQSNLFEFTEIRRATGVIYVLIFSHLSYRYQLDTRAVGLRLIITTELLSRER